MAEAGSRIRPATEDPPCAGQGYPGCRGGCESADYGGIGRFWELTQAAQYLEARGRASHRCRVAVLLLRPGASRGAVSGLIKGLRGEAPFDGGRLPPLPWGGYRVGRDIAFIAEWIDDGCPSDDHLSSIAAARLESPGDGPAKAQLADVTVWRSLPKGSIAAARPPGRTAPARRISIAWTRRRVERLRDGVPRAL